MSPRAPALCIHVFVYFFYVTFPILTLTVSFAKIDMARYRNLYRSYLFLHLDKYRTMIDFETTRPEALFPPSMTFAQSLWRSPWRHDMDPDVAL